MPEAARKDHLNSGPTQQGPSPAVAGSSNVSIGGKPALRVGDRFADGSEVESGAPHVRINGKAAARKGDKVSGGGTVQEGCSRVRIGDGGGPGYGAFEAVRRELEKTATAKDKLLLCLPDIAKAEAERESGIDRQGWLYLRSMFHRWFPGQASDDAHADCLPFLVDLGWVMSFSRARQSYGEFTDRNMSSDLYNIYNAESRRRIGKFLQEDKKLPEQGTTPFDYTAFNPTEYDHKEGRCRQVWHDRSVNFRAVAAQQMPEFGFPGVVRPDGLQVALAGFHLGALAKGYAERNANGGHTIHVTGCSVFAYDTFSFERDARYRYWNCEEKGFSYFSWPGWTELTAADLRSFRLRHGKGKNFVVLSGLLPVADYQEMPYDWP